MRSKMQRNYLFFVLCEKNGRRCVGIPGPGTGLRAARISPLVSHPLRLRLSVRNSDKSRSSSSVVGGRGLAKGGGGNGVRNLQPANKVKSFHDQFENIY